MLEFGKKMKIYAPMVWCLHMESLNCTLRISTIPQKVQEKGGNLRGKKGK